MIVSAPFAAALYALWAGVLSRPYQWAVRPCRIVRDLDADDYRARRLYGLCWTALYYCTPVYFLVLSFPPLKRRVLRLFGLPGAGDFTTYPDTWIRDLPLLDIGAGAYISNRATIGTNIVMASGTILVDHVRIGAGALVGHLSMIGPGAELGERVEIGGGCGVGLRTRIGERASVGPMSTVGNGVEIGARTKLGMRTLVGSGARIAGGLRIPDGCHVPSRAVLRTQEDVDALMSRDATRAAVRVPVRVQLVPTGCSPSRLVPAASASGAVSGDPPARPRGDLPSALPAQRGHRPLLSPEAAEPPCTLATHRPFIELSCCDHMGAWAALLSVVLDEFDIEDLRTPTQCGVSGTPTIDARARLHNEALEALATGAGSVDSSRLATPSRRPRASEASSSPR